VTSEIVVILAAGIEWQSPQMLGISLLIGVLITLAVVLLYPAQVRLLPRAWRYALPALRCAALLALAASVARPVAQRTIREEEQGAVVVLIDTSRSMGVQDTQRTAASKVALADGLGRLPPGVRSRGDVFAAISPDIERLPTLLNDITQAQREVSVAQLQGKENEEAQARFNDAAQAFTQLTKRLAAQRSKLKKSPQMMDALARLDRIPPLNTKAGEGKVELAERTIANVLERAAQFQNESDDALYRSNDQVHATCDELGGLTRLGLVEQALVHVQSGLLARLPARAPLYGYAIGADVTPVPLRGGHDNVKRILLAPDGGKSDLTGGLRQVMELLRFQPVQSVILFSDGRQVGAETSIASSLMGSDVRVYTISPAPPIKEAPVRDVAIERVSLPQSLFVGETLKVSAELRWSGLANKQTQVTLQTGAETQRKIVRADDKGPVNFAVQMSDPGPQQVSITAAPVEGEISTENNTATRWVKVLSDRFDVLLVSGTASWDFRYLRNALSRTQWINPQTVLLDGDNARLGLTPEQILAQDVIILCDAPVKGLSPEQWEAVRKSVAQRGGSVILLAGQSHLPQEYTGEYLSEFLPYRRSTRRIGSPGTGGGGGGGAPVWRTWPGEEPEFRAVPAPRVALADIPSLDDNAGISSDRWLNLPPFFRFLALPELKDLAEPLLVERGSGAPLLTRQRLGRGKVFFLGIDETWRWRSRVGERDQDRFFQQLVRLAADEPYAAANNFLSFDTDRVTIAPGQAVHVRARLVDPSSQPLGWPGLDVDVVGADGEVVKTQRLSVVGPADSGRYEGTIGNLSAGEYHLRARGPEGSELQYPLHVARSLEAEMANLNPDESLLRRLSASSWGDFRTLETFKELPRQLSDLREREPRTAQVRLWSSWYLYAFVLACLGAEWALRKRFGLA
jgi:hypothetical protein